MARITPDMLCLVKKDGECRGMVRTIRPQNDTDVLPMSEGTAWLVEALSSMKAQQIGMIRGINFKIKEMQMSPGTEGWVSECYLYPLPGLDDESERDTEAPKEETRELDHAF